MKRPILCDFHVHTTFSDGKMRLKDVIDLYGVNGFDVIAITDHVFDTQCSHSQEMIENGMNVDNFQKYLQAVQKGALYARKKYDLLVIPGIEVCNNRIGFHILGLDIKESIDANFSAKQVVEEIHHQGGLAIACHPYYKISELQDRQKIEDTTLYLWKNREKYLHMIDAWEIANRNDLFSIVGLDGLPFLANSDFHEKEHLYSWKTQVFASKDTESIKRAIKEQEVSLTLFRNGRKDTCFNGRKDTCFSPSAEIDYFRLAFPELVAN